MRRLFAGSPNSDIATWAGAALSFSLSRCVGSLGVLYKLILVCDEELRLRSKCTHELSLSACDECAIAKLKGAKGGLLAGYASANGIFTTGTPNHLQSKAAVKCCR